MRSVFRRLIPAFPVLPALLAGLCIAATPALRAASSLAFDIEVGAGDGDDPMIVLWLETDGGDFVKTLTMLSKDKKYYKRLSTWWGKREGHEGSVDAVVGPTISFNTERHFEIPLDDGAVKVLAGNLVLRGEQGKDHGPRYRNLKINLPADFKGLTATADDNKDLGYIKKLTLTVK